MKKILLLTTMGIALTGCMNQGVQHLDTTDKRQCAQNFTYDGSFLTGRTFKTNDYIDGINKATAIERATKFTVNDGWSIQNVDKEMGIISASQGVSYSNGKTVPLNISVDSVKGGVNVAMTYSLSGGVSSPVEAVKDHFCSTIEAIKR